MKTITHNNYLSTSGFGQVRSSKSSQQAYEEETDGLSHQTKIHLRGEKENKLFKNIQNDCMSIDASDVQNIRPRS